MILGSLNILSWKPLVMTVTYERNGAIFLVSIILYLPDVMTNNGKQCSDIKEEFTHKVMIICSMNNAIWKTILSNGSVRWLI